MGVEKARYINIGSMLLVAGLVVLSVTIGDKVGLSINRLEEIFSGNEFVGLCILISVVSMAISYWVAVRVTENKEW